MPKKIEYNRSFAYHIEIELGLNLDDIWNWEKNNKNNINPYEITKSCNKKVWLYCLKHDYHNYDREGNKIGYIITCNNFYNKHRCGYCKRTKLIHWKDSLAYNYPNIAKMIAIPKNNLTFEDCYEIACKSHKKFYFQCLDCNKISNKKIILQHVINQKYSCEICSDGISIPEKFIINILKQLDVRFITQLNKTDFNWCNEYRYDFYLFKYNTIIEAHGIQHYEECNLTKRTLEQEQWNDLFKYKCAKNHVNNYIVIDCRYSTLEWLKENIIKELNEYFDLSNINWELAWEESQKSNCIKVWELWNSGLHDTTEIGKILNIDRGTVVAYLKRGVECEKCDYSIEESKKNGHLKKKGKNNCCAKSVICITTNKIFYTITEACDFYRIKNKSGVISCCKGRYKTSGKLKDGTPLIWRYIIWEHNKIYKIKNNDLHFIK